MKNDKSNRIIKAIISGSRNKINAVISHGEEANVNFISIEEFSKWLTETYPDEMISIINDIEENLAERGVEVLSTPTLDKLIEYFDTIKKKVVPENTNLVAADKAK